MGGIKVECPRCGAAVAQGSKFCPSCGKAVAPYRYEFGGPRTAAEANLDMRRAFRSAKVGGGVAIGVGLLMLLVIIAAAAAISNEPIPRTGGVLSGEPCTWADGRAIVVAPGNCERVQGLLGLQWLGWLVIGLGFVLLFMGSIMRRVRAVAS